MAATITTDQTIGISLSSSIDPLTIASNGGVSVASNAPAIYGGYSQAWQVYNAGTLTGGFGIAFGEGGFVSNASTSVIIADGGFGSTGIAMKGSGTVINAGTISSTHYGVVLLAGGDITNQAGGIIEVTSTGSIAAYLGGAGGTISNAGLIMGKYGVKINAGTVINEAGGTIDSTGNDAVLFTGTGNDRVVIDPGAVFHGIVAGSSSASNVLELGAGVTTGTITSLANYSGFTQITLDTDAAWQIDGSIASADTFSFSGDAGALLLAAPGADRGTIDGFHHGDIIGAAGFFATGETFGNGLLTLTNGGAQDILALGGSFTSADFTITTVPAGTEITTDVPCFCAGTRIATTKGDVAVEHLKIGDSVLTLHAGTRKIKWIGTRNYAGPFVAHNHLVLPVQIRRDAIADGIPSRDLFVSPGHALCIDGALVHAWRLLNGVSITQLANVETLNYYHVELDNHEVIFAENCPTETFMGEAFRNQFQNAPEFSSLYPTSVEQTACLPRLDSGFALHAIHRRIAARAGIAAQSSDGPLQGYIDQLTPFTVSGWARATGSEEPVCLDIRAGGHRIGRVIANLFRQDVRDAGHGSGHSGFEFTLPENVPGPITICHSTDGVTLTAPATHHPQSRVG